MFTGTKKTTKRFFYGKLQNKKVSYRYRYYTVSYIYRTGNRYLCDQIEGKILKWY